MMYRPAIAVACAIGMTLTSLTGCGSDRPPLDQERAKQALLTANELPDKGWSLIEATEHVPSGPASQAPLSTGPCQDALHLLDTLGHGAPVYAKASYGKADGPVFDLAVESFAELPDQLRNMKDVVRSCQTGRLDSNGQTADFTMSTPEYPQSQATSARLTVRMPAGEETLDVAVVTQGSNVVVATASGTSGTGPPELLDRAVAKQARKLAEVAGG